MVLLAALSVLTLTLHLHLQECTAFVNPPAARHGIALRTPQQHASRLHITKRRQGRPSARGRSASPLSPSLSPASVTALRMAKKGGGGGGGSKRKKKKAAAAAEGSGGSTTTTATPTVEDGFEDAGSTMMGGGGGGGVGGGRAGGGFAEVKVAKRGEVLEDGVVGTDEAREAKIEETLRKMGVKSIGQVRKEKAEEAKEKGSVGQQITSIFDLIPPETQLLLERVFIAGFALCLLFLVVCGCAIGVEAYFLSTSGKLPPDLDNFIVQKLEPLFTPSLGATFLFSSCLGVLKLGQMGQESVVYREDD